MKWKMWIHRISWRKIRPLKWTLRIPWIFVHCDVKKKDYRNKENLREHVRTSWRKNRPL